MKFIATLLLALVVAQSAAADGMCKWHTMAEGESLWAVADKYKVLQEDLLKALKQCIAYDPNVILQAGQSICIPPYYDGCKSVTAVSGKSNCQVYNVQPGDTMSTIAGLFSLYDKDLAALNKDNINGTGPLQQGNKIKLPPWSSKDCPEPGSDVKDCRVYRVKDGDFIHGVALMFQVTDQELLSANPDITPDKPLSVGQPVKIPPFPSKCGEGVETQPPTDSITSCRAYVAQIGDSLASVAIKFGINTADLSASNPELAEPSVMSPGRKVKIPPFDESCGAGILVNGQSNTLKPQATAVAATPGSAPAPAAVVVQPTGTAVNTSAIAGSIPSVQLPPTSTPRSVPSPPPPPPNPPPPAVPADVGLEFVIGGKTVNEFMMSMNDFTNAIAAAAEVEPSAVTVGAVTEIPPGSRKLLASNLLKANATVSGFAGYTAHNLRNNSDELSTSLSSMGMQLYQMMMTQPDGTYETVVNIATPPPINTETEGSGMGLPMIIGIAAGGGLLVILLLIAVCCCCGCCGKKEKEKDPVRTRRQPSSGVTAYISSTGGSPYAAKKMHSMHRTGSPNMRGTLSAASGKGFSYY